jgi:hypothetical protein
MNKTSLFSLLFLLAAAPVQAQTGLQRAKAQLPRDAARMLEQTVNDARKKGLPTEPLIDKALEGSAKGIPPAVILNAVRAKVDLLARADAALRPFGKPGAADVTATADALQRGVSTDMVKRVRAGRRNDEPVGMALHTLADLLDRKVPVNVAFEVIESWRERGGKSEELREIPAVVERLIRQGKSPTAAGRSVAQPAGGRPSPPGNPGGGGGNSGVGNQGGGVSQGAPSVGTSGGGKGPQKPVTPPKVKGKKN